MEDLVVHMLHLARSMAEKLGLHDLATDIDRLIAKHEPIVTAADELTSGGHGGGKPPPPPGGD